MSYDRGNSGKLFDSGRMIHVARGDCLQRGNDTTTRSPRLDVLDSSLAPIMGSNHFQANLPGYGSNLLCDGNSSLQGRALDATGVVSNIVPSTSAASLVAALIQNPALMTSLLGSSNPIHNANLARSYPLYSALSGSHPLQYQLPMPRNYHDQTLLPSYFVSPSPQMNYDVPLLRHDSYAHEVAVPSSRMSDWQESGPMKKKRRGMENSAATDSFMGHNNAEVRLTSPVSTSNVNSAPELPLPMILGCWEEDKVVVSPHQALLRQQIEVFAADAVDVSYPTRGRNKRIKLGQVGIRCRHCAHRPLKYRQKATSYYPASVLGIYQAAQNMSTDHIQCGLCVDMPDAIKQEFVTLLPTKNVHSIGGRSYWAESAKRLGLIDTENDGIRFGPNIL